MRDNFPLRRNFPVLPYVRYYGKLTVCNRCFNHRQTFKIRAQLREHKTVIFEKKSDASTPHFNLVLAEFAADRVQ